MEEIERIENGSLKRKHFAKLHQKIQNKYEEMQKKLEKSKSVDALPSLEENYVYKHEKSASNFDVREIDEIFGENEHSNHQTQHRIFEEENVHKNSAHFEYVETKESSVSESESSFLIVEKHENNEPTVGKYLNDDFSKMSLES